jgi:hypothetical protein
VDRRRVWRWQCRCDAGEGLDDHRPGGNPIHGLLGWEIDEILALAEEWGPIDRSHRKLAHRGSYVERVWVARSTVRRVLAGHDVDLPAPPPRPEPRPRRPWPDWVECRPRQVWGWDVTHFSRCKAAPNCFAIIDLVSRTWISTLLSPEETAVQTQVVFLAALEAEGLIGLVEHRLETGELPVGDEIPILLAVSDNGPPMTAGDTRAFMALCSIAQHFGRPGVPTDQAPLGLALILLRRQRAAVGLVVAGFFVVIFPGNIAQYTEGTDAFGLDTDTKRLVRLFFQPVLVVWALWSTSAWRWLARRSVARTT